MKSFKHIKFAATVCCGFLFFSGTAAAELNVVTTLPDIASIAKEIGGDFIHVDSIAKGTQDPHYIQAKPSYMVKVNRADLLIYQGLELEIGWLPLLIRGARNPKVLPAQPGHLDLSTVIQPLEIPVGGVDRAMGDIHPFGNPHYNLGPSNALPMARAIADRLALIDPEHSAAYQTHLETFSSRLRTRLKDWKARLGKFPDRKAIMFHKTWNYLFDEFEIEPIGTIEEKPGVPPPPQHLIRLANLMKQREVRVIVQATFYDAGFSNRVAQKTGAQIVILPAYVGGVPEAGDYFSLIEFIVTQLEKAFSSSGAFAAEPTGLNGKPAGATQ